MKSKRNLVLFMICILSITSCNNGTKSPSLSTNLKDEGWLKIDTITYRSDSWDIANKSSSWKVSFDKKLTISKFEDTLNTVRFKIGNGYLEGSDHGEWGGSLIFYSDNDLSKKTNIIEGGNIISIFEFNKNLYALEGTSHLGYSVGKLISLSQIAGIWKYKIILDLKDKPFAYSIINDEFVYIVTNKSLMKINKELESEIIIGNAFWESLYPNSLVIVNSNAIIGMRGLIATVDLVTKKVSAFEKDF